MEPENSGRPDWTAEPAIDPSPSIQNFEGEGSPFHSKANWGEDFEASEPYQDASAAQERDAETDVVWTEFDIAPPLVPDPAESPAGDTWQDIEQAAKIWTRIEPKKNSEPSHELESLQAPVIERPRAQRVVLRKRPPRRRSLTFAAMPALICVLILILGALVALRQQIVRHAPQTASLYAQLGIPVNLRGLQFDSIRTVRETKEGVPVLVVEGEITGTRARLTEVPRLRFAVLDRNGKEIYAWTARPERTLLPPGETLPFRSRLASPPAEASEITVRFFNRHDTHAGLM